MIRFKNPLYRQMYIKYENHEFRYTETDDGTLMSGHHRTKIYAEDLPEWYVYGRYYKEWGFLSTKGITDLRYVPNNWINHFLKDDGLYIAYGGKIEDYEKDEYHPTWERFKGYDHCVCGSEILDILKGAEIYSDYDISGIVQQLRDKRELIAKKHPREFGYDVFKFSIDEWLKKPFCNNRLPKRYEIRLADNKRYYGTMDEIQKAISNYAEFPMKPVKLIKLSLSSIPKTEWTYHRPDGTEMPMRFDAVLIRYIIVKDGDEFIRCISTDLRNLQRKEDNGWIDIDPSNINNDLFEFDLVRNITSINTLLYLPESSTTSNKAQVAELMSNPYCFDDICNELFEE